MYCQYLLIWIFRKNSIYFFAIHYGEFERTRQMTYQEDIFLCKTDFDDNNLERKLWSCFRQCCVRCSSKFLSQLFVILLVFFGCFREIHPSKTCYESIVGWDFCVVQLGTFYRLQEFEQKYFLKKLRPYIVGRSVRDGQVTTHSQLVQNWNVSCKVWKKLHFLWQLSTTLRCLAGRK